MLVEIFWGCTEGRDSAITCVSIGAVRYCQRWAVTRAREKAEEDILGLSGRGAVLNEALLCWDSAALDA